MMEIEERKNYFLYILMSLLVIANTSCKKDKITIKPIIETGSVTDITVTSAKVSGEIIDIGEGITEHGHCWTLNTYPTNTDYHTSLGPVSENTVFISELYDLEAGERYFVAAYAVSKDDVIYGSVQQFITENGIAAISTLDIKEITATTAVSGGNITDNGGAEITHRGVCWDTASNPTVSDSRTIDGIGTGSFTSNLTNLEVNKTYHARAYAINEVDTSYGNEVSFRTRDGFPSLTTLQLSEITTNSAISGGNITDNGGTTIISSGICWSITENPTINDIRTTDGTSTGSFSSSLTNLQPNTTYYVRAYATTDFGTSYGSELMFTTKGLPEVITLEVINITDNSAECGGNVTEDWGFTITSCGVCWNTIGNPTLEINDGFTSNGTGTGIFASSLISLVNGTTYYVRAYAVNSIGIGYGEEKVFETITPFECGTSTIIDYDGNEYTTVQIGDQCWMQENLKVTHYSDGTAIPLVESFSAWDDLGYSDKAYCYFNNTASNGDTYGALYTWTAAMNGVSSSTSNSSVVQGACPTGWHISSDAEWKQLEMHLGMNQSEADRYGYRGTDEGGKLKEAGTAHWANPNTGATNSSGFTALPGGARNYEGDFASIGSYAVFWSIVVGSSAALYRELGNDYSGVYRVKVYSDGRANGLSARCLRDE